jgi:hypothetical protein
VGGWPFLYSANCGWLNVCGCIQSIGFGHLLPGASLYLRGEDIDLSLCRIGGLYVIFENTIPLITSAASKISGSSPLPPVYDHATHETRDFAG